MPRFGGWTYWESVRLRSAPDSYERWRGFWLFRDFLTCSGWILTILYIILLRIEFRTQKTTAEHSIFTTDKVMSVFPFFEILCFLLRQIGCCLVHLLDIFLSYGFDNCGSRSFTHSLGKTRKFILNSRLEAHVLFTFAIQCIWNGNFYLITICNILRDSEFMLSSFSFVSTLPLHSCVTPIFTCSNHSPKWRL